MRTPLNPVNVTIASCIKKSSPSTSMPVLFIGSGVVAASREILKEGTFSPVSSSPLSQPRDTLVFPTDFYHRRRRRDFFSKKEKKNNSSPSTPCLKARRVRFLILPSALLIFFSALFPSYHNIFRLDRHPLSSLLFSSLFIFSPLFFFPFSSPLPEGFVCNHPVDSRATFIFAFYRRFRSPFL